MARRLGRDDSASRAALMDAVEAIMRKNGYAGLSARKIAEVAGLKYQLVFYYFEKIEDLFLETYRRRTSMMIKKYVKALNSERPMHALWKMSTNIENGVLSIEYMAMANQYKSIREESISHVDNIVTEMKKVLPECYYIGSDSVKVNAISVALLVGSIGNFSSFKKSQGILNPAGGEDEIIKMFLEFIE